MRHKHADIIHAWAEGETIQAKVNDGYDKAWIDLETNNPTFYPSNEYRIKPKIIKREGWMNIYRMHDGDRTDCGSVVYKTKQEALSRAGLHAIATVKVEWEEEI